MRTSESFAFSSTPKSAQDDGGDMKVLVKRHSEPQAKNPIQQILRIFAYAEKCSG